MQAIGIDLGTTSICGVVIDIDSGAVLKSRTLNSDAFLDGDYYEKIQSPEKIINLAFGILEEFICEDTKAIGVTGQMHGILYTDKEGKAVSPLYTWQDGRGNLPYKETTYAGYLKSHTGYGNVTHFYNKENGLVPKEAVGFCTVHDYLVMQLCGLKKALVHASDAASFGCFDLSENKFTCECNVEVVNGFEIAGYYKGIPVSVAIGDNQASVFSSLPTNDDILINIGTGSQISVISDQIITAENIETRPYFENKYLIVGAALCGGRAYAVLKDFYKSVIGYFKDADNKEVYDAMCKMADSVTDSPLIADTRFSGTRADETLRGSIKGISTENFTPENLTYSILSGMTNELYDMYSATNIKKTGIVGSGNGIRQNEALIKIIENKFGATLKIPLHTEEAAYGAAMFSLISSGIYKNVSEAQKIIKF